jgi:Holliday junction resolvase-like predicted endonuclease
MGMTFVELQSQQFTVFKPNISEYSVGDIDIAQLAVNKLAFVKLKIEQRNFGKGTVGKQAIIIFALA